MARDLLLVPASAEACGAIVGMSRQVEASPKVLRDSINRGAVKGPGAPLLTRTLCGRRSASCFWSCGSWVWSLAGFLAGTPIFCLL